MNIPTRQKNKGFTLIEMIVVVGIFSIVMVIAMGSIFTVVNANKSSHALASVMDNLNSALDSMSRNSRFGSVYQCSSQPFTVSTSAAVPCPDYGGTMFAYMPYDYYTTGGQQMILYKYIAGVAPAAGRLWRCPSTNTDPASSVGCTPLTAPEVKLTNVKFYVGNVSKVSPAEQPRTFILIEGYALSGTVQQPFYIQTLVSQRELNL